MTIPAEIEKLAREKLLELLRVLIKENAELRAQLEELQRLVPSPAQSSGKSKRQKKRNRPGRKAGQGMFRNRPAPPEEEYSQPPIAVPVSETVCPDCGGELEADGEEMVTNTELPELPKPIVKAYRVQVCKCRTCGKRVRGRHPDVAEDQGGATAHRLGARVQAAGHLLHYRAGLPQRKVPQVLGLLVGLKVTQGALTHSALRAGTGDGLVAQPYQQLRAAIREQAVIHTDDRSWKVGGERAQMMTFESQQATVYQIRPQHRNQEVREVIGDDYPGTRVTDRGKSYEAKELAKVDQQKCLSHIQRSISDVLEAQKGPARCFGEVLKSHLRHAIKLRQDFLDLEKCLPDYEKRVRELEAEISYHLRPGRLKDPDNQRLLKEIGKHHERGHLLRFLHNPLAVEPTNNAAERALRPAVIARKVSQCSKTERGARARESFLSVIGTMVKRGTNNVLESLASLLSRSLPSEDRSLGHSRIAFDPSSH